MIMSDTFYFLAYCDERASVTVIEMAHSVDYQRNDYDFVNDRNHDNRNEAVIYGRDFADRHNLKYKLFESRYDSSLNEYLY